ncbi:MAG: hypothetical protein JNK81_02570 [Anaerolineales bacterium]|nr:hypothetical protein [Anaerolineales bacterium]
MKNKKIQFLPVSLFLTLLLISCSGQATIEPTATIVPTSTATETPIPSPTFTLTLLPTETPIPQPASLVGTIFLSDDAVQPFVSSVELRQKDSFTLIGKSDTDSNGVYKIENIDPGTYELWVLITTKIAMISGCADVAPPDDTWKIGIKFDEDKALSMENAYLSKGLLLAENLQTSDLKAQGFFAVLDGFEIESGVENKMDVVLFCK